MERQRFFAKVGEPDGNGCWPWLAATKWGYGCFSLDGGKKQVRAHRYAYEVWVGPIPDGLTLDHLCRNRSCVNPDHLEPVTMGENVLRGNSITGLNSRKTYCLRGHKFTDENTYRIKKGGRSCKACLRLRALERKERLRAVEPHPQT